MRSKAPTLAWLMTAVSCLMVGMAITEVRSYSSAPLALAPVGVVVTVEVADPPTLTPAPTPTPIRGPGEPLAPRPTPLVEDVPVGLEAGPATLRVARLNVPPSDGLTLEAAPGPTVLLVAAGTLSIWYDDPVMVGPDGDVPVTVLHPGQRLVIAAGARYVVGNDGPTPAVALVVSVVPVGSAPDQESDR